MRGLRLMDRKVKGCATLMGASEVTSEVMGFGRERLCNVDGILNLLVFFLVCVLN